MNLFSRIPDNFFSILSSPKKELYVEALFVLRKAFKTELVIHSRDLTAMLMDSLDQDMADADFSEEASEENGDMGGADISGLSGKAHLLLGRLKRTGWIETEFETGSFEVNITIPDYAIRTINLLYDLSNDKIKEYNSYVYATYAALKNAEETRDYIFQALQTAYQNTVNLVDELKSLFNNIRRYYAKLPGEVSVNLLLREHFDEYKEEIVDKVYYPLKTIDSVPRFRNSIMRILNSWLMDDAAIQLIVDQGVMRRVFSDGKEGRDETIRMINYVTDTYDSIEEMIAQIDQKHNDYTNSSIERIRYLMNSDRSIKGKLVDLLKAAPAQKTVMEEMENAVNVYSHRFVDGQSLYQKVKRTARSEGSYQKLDTKPGDPSAMEGFLSEVRKQYTNKKIDDFIEKWLGTDSEKDTSRIVIRNSEDFILVLLGTIRGTEKSAGYTVTFGKGNVNSQGYSIPEAVFRRKTGSRNTNV